MRSRMLSSSAAGPEPVSTSCSNSSSSATNSWIALSERVASSPTSRAPAQRGGEGDPLAVGEGLDAGLGPLADAALRGVEDPAQADDVGRVGDDPQVGQRVADLLALVEAHAADDLVGHADPDEHLLEHPGRRVGAVEDRDVLGLGRALVDQRVDLLGDPGGLVVLVVGDVAVDQLAVAGVGPQVLRLAAGVAGDDRVGRRAGCVWVER